MLYFLKNYLLFFGYIYYNSFSVKSLDQVSFGFLDFDFHILIKNRVGFCADSYGFFGGFYHFCDKIFFSVLLQPELTWTPYYVFNIYYTWNDLAAGFSIYNDKGMRVFYFSFRCYLFSSKRFSLLWKGSLKMFSFGCGKKLGACVNNVKSFDFENDREKKTKQESESNHSILKDQKDQGNKTNVTRSRSQSLSNNSTTIPETWSRKETNVYCNDYDKYDFEGFSNFPSLGVSIQQITTPSKGDNEKKNKLF